MIKNPETKLRTAAFLQFVVIAGVLPVISLYLRGIEGISGTRIGIILSMSTVASVISPLLSLYVADRIVKTETLFALCNIVSAFLLVLLRLQKSFATLAATYLLLMLFLTPPSTLVNIMVFKHLGKARGRFGGIRVWGTFGWIFMSLFFSYVWLGDMFVKIPGKSIGDVLYFSSATALFLGFFSLTFDSPASGVITTSAPPALTAKKQAKERHDRSEKVARGGAGSRKQVAGKLLPLFAISFLISSVDKYYYLGLSPFLRQSGIPDRWIMPVISAGNISEIILMFLLFKILARFGFRKTLAAGTAAEILRFTLFSFSESFAPVFAGILVHGATFALYSSAAYIYLDTLSSDKKRTANHLFYSFVMSGGGNLFGNLAAGRILDFSLAETGGFSLFWAVPAIISLLSMILVVIFIDERKPV